MWAALALAKIDIPLGDEIIPKGSEITITHGRDEVYAIWRYYIWDLNEMYVGDIIRIYSHD